ncbi:MAG: DNA mismatch repair endonuclease MutL [Defluviitaleaceae bacterium]|nr:DNA mismatch repair endonuclease MutL [Defluviitaleaceae bacterium]
MNNIIILDDSLINKIAAGEVVERPGSVVKELVENSIDSGATRIKIETMGGGIDMIKVSDNGSGISEGDVYSAFMRHATSKIRNMNDLENVLTLGFRGEGLSSIAAVSQVEIITKPKEQLMAKRLEIHGGKIISDGFTGAIDGTSISVRNLFYNTPARRKFLKKPATESGQISDIVTRFALARPDISFEYIVNGSPNINTKEGGSLQTAALAVYGIEIAKNMIEIKEQAAGGIEISGLIGKPEISRGNRNYGSIFINGRYIKAKILEKSIEEGYKNRLTVGKFPVYILNLKLDPNMIDVNVHPQKLEVRFSDESAIYNIFYNGVFNGLRNEVLIPEVNIVKEEPLFIPSVEKTKDLSPKSTYTVNMDSVMGSLFGKNKDEQKPLAINEALTLKGYNYYDKEPVAESLNLESSISSKPTQFFHNYSIVGQFLATYWLIEQDDEVYLVDQHAAHERVVYERLINEYQNSQIFSQKLIDPMIINLSDGEAAIMADNEKLFSRFGYDIEHINANEYAVKSVPFILRGATDIALFMQILDKLSEDLNSVTNIFGEKLEAIAQVACKAAVKANDRIHITEARGLIAELLKLENPFNCPHGRPTIIKLTKYEIEKMFKRIQ